MSDDTASECCEVCGASNFNTELFGYPTGWRWFCAAHRLGQHYAYKRLAKLANDNNDNNTNGDSNEQISDDD